MRAVLTQARLKEVLLYFPSIEQYIDTIIKFKGIK